MTLRLENLGKSFHQGQAKIDVIHDLNLDLNEGDVVAIVGESGCGKSTLLSLLAGLDRPDVGLIKFLETDLAQLDEAELTHFRGQNIGIVFQQYHLMDHLTALENVSLALEIQGRPNAAASAEKLLRQVGLGERLHHFPSQLSGGESQRVAIARALVVQPRILLADEPSGNLDDKTGAQVMDLFFKMVKEQNVTTVLVTHSRELARRCQKIFQLQNGQLMNLGHSN